MFHTSLSLHIAIILGSAREKSSVIYRKDFGRESYIDIQSSINKMLPSSGGGRGVRRDTRVHHLTYMHGHQGFLSMMV